jgi:NAD(P)-dependent dehydrogenase (short-subunit alcohol dehydrogenase family)
MARRTWFITGVSSGLGLRMTEQLLERGDRVFGTIREPGGARNEFRYGSAK